MPLKRTVAVVANGLDSGNVAQSIKRDLLTVLGDCADVIIYFANQLEEHTLIDTDVVLVLDSDKIYQLQPHIKHNESILFVERTFRKENLEFLYSIKKGTSVLVVNSTWPTTVETVEHLYKATRGHLRYIPYIPETRYDGVNIAVTPGERSYVPSFIKEVYDIQNRCISMYTFIRLMNMLNISGSQYSRRLLRYSSAIVSIDSSIDKQYKELILKNLLLENISTKGNVGIAVTDESYHVVYHNKKASDMLKLPQLSGDLRAILLKLDETIDIGREFVETLSQNLIPRLLISKSVMESPDGIGAEYCFEIRDEVYIKDLGNSLSAEMKKKGLTARYTFDDMNTVSRIMEEAISYAKKVAVSNYPVLITGETGSGKELVAQSIHNASHRRYGPFVAVNCAALPESLLESQLFGYEKGAFTGADAKGKIGLFEQAHGGSIFLDEIGDMPVLLQTRLLRVLQERQIMRLGGDRYIDVDVRVIAATNQDLEKLIQKSAFRMDVLFRINTFEIALPPLRSRRKDISLLLNKMTDGKSESIPLQSLELLNHYPFPGNVRELQNVANYINVIAADIPPYIKRYGQKQLSIEPPVLDSLSALETKAFLQAVEQRGCNSIGRDKLRLLLNEQGYRIGEHRIKSAAAQLVSLGYLEIPRGRSGMRLTPLGIQLLNNWNETHISFS